jgi:hypothetical protein
MRLARNFNDGAGGDGGLAGRISTEHETALGSGHHVVMWSVIARNIDTTWTLWSGPITKPALPD